MKIERMKNGYVVKTTMLADKYILLGGVFVNQTQDKFQRRLDVLIEKKGHFIEKFYERNTITGYIFNCGDNCIKVSSIKPKIIFKN